MLGEVLEALDHFVSEAAYEDQRGFAEGGAHFRRMTRVGTRLIFATALLGRAATRKMRGRHQNRIALGPDLVRARSVRHDLAGDCAKRILNHWRALRT